MSFMIRHLDYFRQHFLRVIHRGLPSDDIVGGPLIRNDGPSTNMLAIGSESGKLPQTEQAIDFESASDNGAQRRVVYNNNSITNIMHGSGIINNHNPINSTVHPVTPQDRDAIAARIAAVLRERHVPQAVYDAHLSSGCVDGTRVEILRIIEAWIKSPDGPAVFWLVGMAGMGKTAIGWTICSRVSAGNKIVLGGSFFCSRSTGSMAQRDVRCIVPTLAQLLALQSTEFSKALADELYRDPGVLHKQVGAQVKQLLYQPLLALKTSRIPIIFVIDALDECGEQSTADGMDDEESHRIVSEMLEALVAFSSFPVKLPVKFLITSRPETHIRDTRVSDSTFSKVLRLHVVDKEQVTADIQLYIRTRLLSNPRLRTYFTDNDIRRLARLSDGLFIFAATALHYTLEKGVDSAVMRFESLLNSAGDGLGTTAAAPLDRMYTFILDDVTKAEEPEAYYVPEILQVLASILCMRTTLSVSALADLLDMHVHHLRAHLSRLHAIVRVPEKDTEPGLRILHASFGDYLFRRAPPKTRIAKSFGHDLLTRGCLRRMARDDLCFNVSNSRSSYKKNGPISVDMIAPSLVYACLQWAHHIAFTSDSSESDLLVEQELIPKFLFWLEVLSVLGKVGVASGLLRIAGRAVKRNIVLRFLRDANSFVASSREAIELSAPHIYLSALPFAAKDSLVYQTFAPLCTGTVSAELFGIDRHGGRLAMTLTGHEHRVYSVVYSPDGQLLISGSADGTVRIWDTRTGDEVMSPLHNGDSAINSIALSPNGKCIASGSDDGVVCIWTDLSGQPNVHRLRGHSGPVLSVVYSLDGSIIASGSEDGTIRLWSTHTGESIVELNDHSADVKSVAFSADVQLMASGSNDETTRLWRLGSGGSVDPSFVLHEESGVSSVCFSSDGGLLASGITNGTIVLRESRTGDTTTTLRGHVDWVRSVQFSSDGQSLVSASYDRTVRIWTLRRDEVEASSAVLTGHTDCVRSATFSPNGLYIASASFDRTIRIWDVGSGTRVVEPLPAHDDEIKSVAVSPDGSLIVSGSVDRSVRVWDARTGEPRLPPLLGHTDIVLAVAISCDGLMIASASADHRVRIWSAQTGRAIGLPLRGHGSIVRAVSFSPNAQKLASGSRDGMVYIWDVSTEVPSITRSLEFGGDIRTVAFSPDGQLLAVGGGGRQICLWQAATGQPVHETFQTNYSAFSVAFSPSRTDIVSAEFLKVPVRDIATGKQTLVIECDIGPTCSATFSNDSQYICAGAGNVVYVWDAMTGTLISALCGHVKAVRSVVFTPSGQSIVSCADDRTIRIWDVETACSRLPLARDDPTLALTFNGLKEGWLLGPSGELLLWVPEEYRDYIYAAPCTFLIGPRRIVLTAGDHVLHRGENWMKCWRNAKPTLLSHLM